jgi:hypothetical protein
MKIHETTIAKRIFAQQIEYKNEYENNNTTYHFAHVAAAALSQSAEGYRTVHHWERVRSLLKRL